MCPDKIFDMSICCNYIHLTVHLPARHTFFPFSKLRTELDRSLESNEDGNGWTDILEKVVN